MKSNKINIYTVAQRKPRHNEDILMIGCRNYGFFDFIKTKLVTVERCWNNDEDGEQLSYSNTQNHKKIISQGMRLMFIDQDGIELKDTELYLLLSDVEDILQAEGL